MYVEIGLHPAAGDSRVAKDKFQMEVPNMDGL